MARTRNPLAIAACISLLSLQLGGVHVHADETGFTGAPETPFTHSHTHHDHDRSHHGSGLAADDGDHEEVNPAHEYDDATDVSLLDLALSTFKMPLAVLTLFLLFAVFPIRAALTGIDLAYPVLSGRHTRWRPPLRAPPQPA